MLVVGRDAPVVAALEPIEQERERRRLVRAREEARPRLAAGDGARVRVELVPRRLRAARGRAGVGVGGKGERARETSRVQTKRASTKNPRRRDARARSIPVLVEVRADEAKLGVAHEEQPAEFMQPRGQRALQRQALALVEPFGAAFRLRRGQADELPARVLPAAPAGGLPARRSRARARHAIGDRMLRAPRHRFEQRDEHARADAGELAHEQALARREHQPRRAQERRERRVARRDRAVARASTDRGRSRRPPGSFVRGLGRWPGGREA